MSLLEIAGWSSLVAAVATVVGAVLLALFFARGEPWGTLNDIASVVLMVATIPVAIAIAGIENRIPFPGALAFVAAAVGVAGMLAAAAFQTALVLRLRTYQQLLSRTLGAGAVVGVWYLLVAALSIGNALPGWAAVLAALSGVGFIAIGYGFAVANERHPLSVGGGLLLFVASTAFLTWFGLAALGGGLALATGNA